MSDSTTNIPAQPAESDKPFQPKHPGADWFLQKLVGFANIGICSGITLQVHGMIISGTTITGRKYFEEFAKSFGGGFRGDSELATSFTEMFASYAKIYDKDPEDQKFDDEPGYIHLENASFFLPGQPAMPRNSGVLWRGKISDVTGFNLGILSRE